VVAGTKHSQSKEVTVKASQVDLAISKSGIDIISADLGLSYALQIIRLILADMPWYKKVILSVKFLIGGIEEYLRGKGWDV
jgi:hypothetical protein